MGTDHELGYGRQWIAPEDVEAVARVLRGAHLTQGPAVGAFEAALCLPEDERAESPADLTRSRRGAGLRFR